MCNFGMFPMRESNEENGLFKKMNRREFTHNISRLIQIMIAEGHEPILDFALRSKEEQKRLFDLGLSKCDGTKKISKHQKGLAADIYFVVNGQVDYDYKKTSDLSIKYHNLWVQMGGKPIISWDNPHYEG